MRPTPSRPTTCGPTSRSASTPWRWCRRGATIIHHCNTGSLATVDYGTALGVIRTAHEQGRTCTPISTRRPRHEAGLSAWELLQLGVPHTVIVDGASGHIMRTRGVDLCVVGCDRVAAGSDTANKIGTYNLALVALRTASRSTWPRPPAPSTWTRPPAMTSPSRSGPPRMTTIGGVQVTPDGANVANPAFDVTPARYISAIITEMGIAYPPTRKCKRAGRRGRRRAARYGAAARGTSEGSTKPSPQEIV
ncbi:MAG: hypothetical protein R2854_24775 [Caldilineaceae bacterium]